MADLVDPCLLEAAAARFPGVTVDETVFRAYVDARFSCAEASAPTAEALADPERLSSLYLCCACLAGNASACAAFQQAYLGVIRNAIARIIPRREWLDDVASQCLGQLLVGSSPRLGRYSGRGDLAAWLKVVATRAALDAKRSLPEKEEDPPSSSLHDVRSMSPESLVLCRTHGIALVDALASALTALDQRQQNLLRLSYADELSIDEIGALYGVHRATAARWVQQARAAVESAVRGSLRARHRLDDSEVSTLVRGLGPELETSLRAVLAERRDDEPFEDLAPSE
jgi:RNA polymerase sigma-70 factor, ECF subfamily